MRLRPTPKRTNERFELYSCIAVGFELFFTSVVAQRFVQLFTATHPQFIVVTFFSRLKSAYMSFAFFAGRLQKNILPVIRAFEFNCRTRTIRFIRSIRKIRVTQLQFLVRCKLIRTPKSIRVIRAVHPCESASCCWQFIRNTPPNKKAAQSARPFCLLPAKNQTVVVAGVVTQNLSNAPTRSCAMACALRPSICQRSSMKTTSPSFINAIDGELGA